MGSIAVATRQRSASGATRPDAKKRASPAGGARAGMPVFLQRAPQAESAVAEQAQAKCDRCEEDEAQPQVAAAGQVQAKCGCGASPPPGGAGGGEDLDEDARVAKKVGGGLCAACASRAAGQRGGPAHGTHAIATEGVRGATAELPHLERIQASFGRHDVTGVRVEVGGAAETASGRMGALAYTVGDRIGFRGPPDLKLAAHEAAHVVQQRSGAKLPGGVGQPDDAHERQADEVAETVARGESAERLLDATAGRGGGTGPVVQHRREPPADGGPATPEEAPEAMPSQAPEADRGTRAAEERAAAPTGPAGAGATGATDVPAAAPAQAVPRPAPGSPAPAPAEGAAPEPAAPAEPASAESAPQDGGQAGAEASGGAAATGGESAPQAAAPGEGAAAPGFAPRPAEVEPEAPGIDFDRLAESAPSLRPVLSQLATITAEKKAEVTNLASSRRTAVQGAATAARDEIRLLSETLVDRARTEVGAARAGVLSTIAAQRAAVTQGIADRSAAAAEIASSEAGNLGTESAAIATSVRTAATENTGQAEALGTQQAERARTEVARQAAEARRRGDEKAASYQDADADRAETQRAAARDVANEQARDIEGTAPELARFAQERAGEIATSFTTEAERVAGEIERASPQVQEQVGALGGSAAGQIATIGQAALDALAAMEQTLSQQLDELERTAAAQAERMATELLPQVDAVEQASLVQVDQLEREGHAQVDAAAAGVVTSLAEGAAGSRVGAGEDVAAGPTAVVSAVQEAFGQMEAQVGSQLGGLTEAARTGAQQLDEQLAAGTGGATAAAESEASSIGSAALDGMQGVCDDVASTARGLVGDALTRFRTPAEEAVRAFETAYREGETEVTTGVTEGLDRNAQALSQLDASMGAAAAHAAEEYDRPAWQKVLLAVGKAVLFLALALVLIYVLAGVIFVVGLLLVKAGIIAGITFAAALAIAVVVVAIGFVVLELYQRIEAYRAEHGPVGSFWEALGISFALLGISIASLTGIPQIIEGARGRRFFSDRRLTSQEQYDLVIGGALQLLLLVAGVVGRVRGGRSGGGPREPGFLERLNRTIERTLERWILGEEKTPGGGRPGQPGPGEERPPEAPPGSGEEIVSEFFARGHRFIVRRNGRIEICSTCAEIAMRYADVLNDPAHEGLASRLESIRGDFAKVDAMKQRALEGDMDAAWEAPAAEAKAQRALDALEADLARAEAVRRPPPGPDASLHDRMQHEIRESMRDRTGGRGRDVDNWELLDTGRPHRMANPDPNLPEPVSDQVRYQATVQDNGTGERLDISVNYHEPTGMFGIIKFASGKK